MTHSFLPLPDLRSIGIDKIYQAAASNSAGTNRASNGLLVRCPASNHDDVHPSCLLNLSVGIWTCFGCSAHGDKLDLIIAAGRARTRSEAAAWLAENLSRRPRALQAQPRAQTRSLVAGVVASVRQLVATHAYQSASGDVVYEIRRFAVGASGGEKTFTTRRPDGLGNWIYHRSAACERAQCPCRGSGPLARRELTPVPYNAPALLAAGRDGRGVLCEGESDADRLIALGFVASTNAFGTNFKYPETWRKYFDAVPRWIVICDADLPGRKAAAERAAWIGPTAIVVDLFPSDDATSHGRDVSDWLSERPGTVDQQRAALIDLLRAACGK
jgi:hypothetical protein